MYLTNVAAIVFDVDGTLYPQRPLRARMLCELSFALARNPRRELRTLKVLRAYRKAQELAREPGDAAQSSDLQLQIACRICGEEPPCVAESAREWFERRPLRHLKACAYRHVAAFLREAKGRGILLGVVSDYPAIHKLQAMGIADYFGAVISSKDESIAALKPHPRGLQTCLARLGARPEESVYVGDRADVDLLCALNARTRFVLMGNPRPQPGCLSVRSYRQLGKLFGFEAKSRRWESSYAS